MAVLHITDAELARDVHAVLAKVQEGAEVVIEQDHRAVAVMRTPPRPGRSIDDCIALAKDYEAKLGHAPVPDPDFAADVEQIVRDRQPWSPPSWD